MNNPESSSCFESYEDFHPYGFCVVPPESSIKKHTMEEFYREVADVKPFAYIRGTEVGYNIVASVIVYGTEPMVVYFVDTYTTLFTHFYFIQDVVHLVTEYLENNLRLSNELRYRIFDNFRAMIRRMRHHKAIIPQDTYPSVFDIRSNSGLVNIAFEEDYIRREADVDMDVDDGRAEWLNSTLNEDDYDDDNNVRTATSSDFDKKEFRHATMRQHNERMWCSPRYRAHYSICGVSDDYLRYYVARANSVTYHTAPHTLANVSPYLGYLTFERLKMTQEVYRRWFGL